MQKLKKIELEIDEYGYACKYFKINGKKYGYGITGVDIKIVNEKPPVQVYIKGIKKEMDEDINDIENVFIFEEE